MNRPTSDIVKELNRRGLKIACAESCTGGLLADSFVSVSGASNVFLGGLVAYDEKVKASVLGVSAKALKHGAVSAECAEDMAKKALRLFNADIAMAITGYAEKSDRPDVEDGTIFIALAAKKHVGVLKIILDGSRNSNRKQAVSGALDMLWNFLDENACQTPQTIE